MAFQRGAWRDVQQEITDTIIRQIEAGARGEDWRMPWHRGAADNFGGSMPVNVAGKPYSGLNVILLWISANENKYSRPIWGTFKAWEAAGGMVEKGQKATMGFFWAKRCKVCKKMVFFGKENEHAKLHPREVVEFSMFTKEFWLFNIAQLATVPKKFDTTEPTPAETTETVSKRIAEAEKYFAAINANVKHGGNKACYIPALDSIKMPFFEQFNTPEDYYSTLGHEHGHLTGHASRCNRDLNNRFGTEAYAMEELVAEFIAAFVCGYLGIANNPRPDHAQYIAGWLKKLGEDKTALFTANKLANAGFKYLNDMAGETETEELPIAA